MSTPHPPIPRPKALVFDWDNTLVDSWTTIHAALEVTFTAMGHVPWTLDETRERVRYSMRESFPQLFGDDWERARDIFYDAFERLHLERLVPTSGATDMLRTFHDAGLCLAVVSNKTGRYLRQEAAHLDWDRFFHSIVGAGDAARDKPAEDPIHMALAGSDIAAGPDVWFVGDSNVDMEIAHRTNCIPVLVRHDDPVEDEFNDFQPRVHFRSCIELASHVITL